MARIIQLKLPCELPPEPVEQGYTVLVKRTGKGKTAEWCRNRQVERRELGIRTKGDKCYNCGGTFPPPVYEFHHVDPNTKKFRGKTRRSVLAMTNTRIEVFMKELDKCVMLCANCHRMVHAGMVTIGEAA